MADLRIIFFGTAELACASLSALAASGIGEVVGVVTQPDRPKGRELKLTPSPVKTLAEELKLPVLQPARARDPQFIQTLAELRPDLIVVAAYGQILPPAILDLPRHGCLNVHTSLLPKHRGAAPIQWAILNGDCETGVTIMKMDPGLDTGGILTQQTTPIVPEDNAQTLHDRLARLGAELLLQTIPDYVSGNILPHPQLPEGASYARKITKEDGRLDWNHPARGLWNQIRALTPWPGSFTFLPGTTERPLLKIWQAEVIENTSGQSGEILRAERADLVVACGEQALGLLVLQREGGRRLSAAEFLSGHPLQAGLRLLTVQSPLP